MVTTMAWRSYGCDRRTIVITTSLLGAQGRVGQGQVGEAGATVNVRWLSGDDDAVAIVQLRSLRRCHHCVVVAGARECGGGGERARARARWANGHGNGVTIATARSSRHHRVVVVGVREGRRGQGEGKGRGE